MIYFQRSSHQKKVHRQVYDPFKGFVLFLHVFLSFVSELEYFIDISFTFMYAVCYITTTASVIIQFLLVLILVPMRKEEEIKHALILYSILLH